MAGTFKEKDVGSGWPKEMCITISQKLPEQKSLEVEHLPIKQEDQTPIQKQQAGCEWHIPVVPAAMEAEDFSLPEQKHETFSEKPMKAENNPEPGSSYRDLKFNL
jgi:hypothetical protein